jgi:hypothetical protein
VVSVIIARSHDRYGQYDLGYRAEDSLAGVVLLDRQTIYRAGERAGWMSSGGFATNRHSHNAAAGNHGCPGMPRRASISVR